LSRQTVAVLGPEKMPLSEAVRRVAKVVGKRPIFLPMPVWLHYALAILLEATITIPLASRAQVRILSEGIVEPLPACTGLPDDLLPSTRFTDEKIRQGLPQPAAFNRKDLRCCS
jgi:NADH dehydrogenase